jgi:hypothetical protein
MEQSVLIEVEKLRRASLAALRQKYGEVFQEETRCRHRQHLFRRIAWRLQVLAEGDLTQRARQRAHQIARDADLRTVAPRDFLTLVARRSRRRQGTARAGPTTAASPCRVPCSHASGKGGAFWWRSWRRDSAMRTGLIPL